VTYNGSNVRVYVNGIEHAVFPLTMTYVNQAVPIQIGRTATNNEFFNGEIDEVRIWTNVLTPANIGSNTTKELNGNEFGLVAYYKFNDGIPASNNMSITSVNNFAAATAAQPMDGVLNGFAKTGSTSNFVESTALDLNVIRPNPEHPRRPPDPPDRQRPEEQRHAARDAELAAEQAKGCAVDPEGEREPARAARVEGR
jgi:hypothetical protein